MPEKLSYEDFLESLRLSPRLTVELVITNTKGEILLLKRDKYPFKDYWHLPGGFLLKGESLSDCFQRIALDELKTNLNYSDSKFEGLFENINGDPRGHILHFVTRLVSNEISEGKYFANLSDNTIPFQRDFLMKLGFK